MMAANLQTAIGFLFLVGSVNCREVPLEHRIDKRQADNFDAETFMEKYGYLDDIQGSHHSPASRSLGIQEFQRFNGLPVTGRLDRLTTSKMRQPRCGLPDVVKPSQPANGIRSGPNVPLAFYAPGYKWPRHNIKYKIVGYTRKVSGEAQQRAFRNAFAKWSEVTPLNFEEVTSGNVDIEIDFARYVHGDGQGNAFDGRGKTLAHAFFPGRQPISGDTHFDDDEEWTMDAGNRGTNLEIVAAHEFGHALGMGHSNVPLALMAPYYRYAEGYGLHDDDKRGIQTLYGSSPRSRPPRPTRPSRPVRPRGRHCNVKFDDIAVGHDGNTYAFRRRKIYKLTSRGVARGFPKNTRRIYRRSPNSPSAVVYDRTRQKMYFFKGSRFWRYTGFALDSGYPKRLPSAFRRAGAAFQWRDGRIYLLKDNSYIAWTEGLTQAPTGYPRAISQFWRGLRPKIEAAFQYTDGETYFFKGTIYWKFDSDYGQVQRGYPKRKSQAWLGCTPRIPK